MKPHDNYIMHFNKNHDPRNGQFTKGPGGSSSNISSKKRSSNSSKSVEYYKKKSEEYIKKHPDQAKYITIGDDGHMRFDVMRWQIDEDLKQASDRLTRKNQNVKNKTSKEPTKSKNISEMSDDELDERLKRLRMEDEYKRLTKSDINKKGSNYLRKLPSKLFDMAVSTLWGAALKVAGKKLTKKLSETL